MAHEEPEEPRDARTTRSSRRDTPPTERFGADDSAYGDPVNPDWRGTRSTGRNRRSQSLPSSRQEFVLWLQYGGWKVLAAAIVLVAVFIGIMYLTRTPSTASSPFERTEIPASGAVLLPLPTVTPGVITPTLTTAPAAANNTSGGAQFRVYNTGSEGLFLRSDHSSDSVVAKTLPDGSVVTIIGQDFSGPDRVWKNVRDADGSEGWVAADFLQAVP